MANILSSTGYSTASTGGGGDSANTGKVLNYSGRAAVSGSGLTWGDNGDNITVTVAIASSVATKPSEMMGYVLWDTGFTAADLPALQMNISRVTSPTSATTGPPACVYGYVIDASTGDVDFASSISRWGGVVWGVGTNGDNNQLTVRLRANQTFNFSGNLTNDGSAPTNYNFAQYLRFLLIQQVPNSSGTAGNIIFTLTNCTSNYPGSGGTGTSESSVLDNSNSGSITGTDKVFAFLGIFRRTNVGSGTVDLEFKLTDFSTKAP